MNEQKEGEAKIKKRKSKKVEKKVIGTNCDKEENTTDQESAISEVKRKSYSAAIKLNLSKQSCNNLTVSSSIQPVPNSSPLDSSLVSSLTKNQSEEDSVVGKETSSSVPTPYIWEQTHRRRKNRVNKKKEDPPCPEKIEVIPNNTEQKSSVCDVIESKNENIENTAIEIVDEIEAKTVKNRRRKSKTGRKDSESNNIHHRIMIRDDQFDIKESRSEKYTPQVLMAAFGDQMERAAYRDTLVVSGLGSGISRGCMDYGRLYQSKYIPPNRTDGLNPDCTYKECVKEKESAKQDMHNIKKSSDIDLD